MTKPTCPDCHKTYPGEGTRRLTILGHELDAHARRNRYAPPMAWDNIDNPNEQPQGIEWEDAA